MPDPINSSPSLVRFPPERDDHAHAEISLASAIYGIGLLAWRRLQEPVRAGFITRVGGAGPDSIHLTLPSLDVRSS